MHAASMPGDRTTSSLMFMLMAIGIGIAVVIAVAMVQFSQRAELPFDSAKSNPITPPAFGVVGEITVNGIEQAFRASSLNLSAGLSESRDSQIPSVPFEGEFTVTFDRGRVAYARIGAEVQGGSIIVMRGGEVLLSDYATPVEPRIILTRIPVELSKRREQITYIFKSDGAGPTRLRAMWLPEAADQPSPLPGSIP